MTATTRKTLPASLDHLYEAMEFVVFFAEEQGFPPNRIMELELSLEEALVNIIRYAYPDGNGDMEISCIMGGQDQFVVEISDTGIPFDILSAREPDVTADVEDRKIGGLGIYFIRRLMDDVTYVREDDRNILRLKVLKEKVTG